MIFFTKKKGIMAKLEKIEILNQMVFIFVWLIAFLVMSFNTTTKICFCEFKESYYELQNIQREIDIKLNHLQKELDVPIEEYECDETPMKNVKLVSTYEMVLTGIYITSLIWYTV